MDMEVVWHLLEQAVPTDSCWRAGPTTVTQGARPRDFGSIQVRYNAWIPSKMWSGC